MVDGAVARGSVDGVEDWRPRCRWPSCPTSSAGRAISVTHLIDWGGATFDILGPAQSASVEGGSANDCRCCGSPDGWSVDATVLDGSMADELLRAADEGMLSHAECPALMVDYIAPSLDTTISAISNALYLFATHPEQWRLLKERPGADPESRQRGGPLRVSAARVRPPGAGATPRSPVRRSRPARGCW